MPAELIFPTVDEAMEVLGITFGDTFSSQSKGSLGINKVPQGVFGESFSSNHSFGLVLPQLVWLGQNKKPFSLTILTTQNSLNPIHHIIFFLPLVTSWGGHHPHYNVIQLSKVNNRGRCLHKLKNFFRNFRLLYNKKNFL